MRGGIAERGGVRVGHRIIEINGQSVVATPHEKIVHILSNAVGEVGVRSGVGGGGSPGVPGLALVRPHTGLPGSVLSGPQHCPIARTVHFSPDLAQRPAVPESTSCQRERVSFALFAPLPFWTLGFIRVASPRSCPNSVRFSG